MITWWIERFSQTFMLVETHIGCYLLSTVYFQCYGIFSIQENIYFTSGSRTMAGPIILFLQMSIHVLRFFNTSEN